MSPNIYFSIVSEIAFFTFLAVLSLSFILFLFLTKSKSINQGFQIITKGSNGSIAKRMGFYFLSNFNVGSSENGKKSAARPFALDARSEKDYT